MSKFSEVFPISFDLMDKDAQNVLYITETADQELSLEIKNSGKKDLQLKKLDGTPGKDQYHFALHFRPGTLSEASLSDSKGITLKADDLAKWVCSKPTKDAEGMYVLYLRSTDTLNLEVGKIEKLTFTHVGADGKQGARGTRVKMSYDNLKFLDGGAIRASAREIHMDIINHRGRQNLPLDVGFVGDNGILNDGKTPNAITLRFRNTMKPDALDPKRSALVFLHEDGETKRSEFEISFDDIEGDKTASLTDTKGVHAVKIETLDLWRIESNSQGKDKTWKLYPSTRNITLTPKGHFDLIISHIVTDFPLGHTHVHISYRNIPGYWDGQITVPLEKRPMAFLKDNSIYAVNKGKGARVLFLESLPSEEDKHDTVEALKVYNDSKSNATIYAQNKGIGKAMELTNASSTSIALLVNNFGEFEDKNGQKQQKGNSECAILAGNYSTFHPTISSINRGSGFGIVVENSSGSYATLSVKNNGINEEPKKPGACAIEACNNSHSSSTIYAENKGTGYGMKVKNASSGYYTIYAENLGTTDTNKKPKGDSACAIVAYNNSASQAAIYAENQGTGYGMKVKNASSGYYTIYAENFGTTDTNKKLKGDSACAIVAYNNSASQAAIYAKNQGTGHGMHVVNNSSLAAGKYHTVYAQNEGNGYAIYATCSAGRSIYSGGGINTGSTGDFAEFFESKEKAAIPVGTSVFLEFDAQDNRAYLRPAKPGEVPIGIISGAPAVLGNHPMEWPGMYERDEYGQPKRVVRKKTRVQKKRIKMEEVAEQVKVIKTRTLTNQDDNPQEEEYEDTETQIVERPVLEEREAFDQDGHSLGVHLLPVLETYAEEVDELDADGKPVMVDAPAGATEYELKLNEDHDPNRAYIPRSDRPEWHIVGLLGQLPMLVGQPTAPGWIKLRGAIDNVEIWLVK